MTNWRRACVPDGTFFFTLATADRASILTTSLGRATLREVLVDRHLRWPFDVEAIVLMPDHLHALWQLPAGDADYSKRSGWLKKEFTRRWLARGGGELSVYGEIAGAL
jgi:putative transposase